MIRDTQLKDLLSNDKLMSYGGITIYRRGLIYYLQNKVSIESVNDSEAYCLVLGSRIYEVNLWLDDDLMVDCTCPYADKGYFCKHMVAAGMAVYEELKTRVEPWRQQLNYMLDEDVAKAVHKPWPLWIFISLQKENQNWQLIPYHIRLDTLPTDVFPNVVFPDDESKIIAQLADLIVHNQQLQNKIKTQNADYSPNACRNIDNEAVAFINLLRKEQKQYAYNYYYYYYSYPLAQYLQILSQFSIPVYYGTKNNPTQAAITILSKPIQIRFSLDRKDGNINLETIITSQEWDMFSGNTMKLTAGNTSWYLKGNTVFKIDASFPLKDATSFLRQPKIQIPVEAEDEFLEDYFIPLANQFPVEGDLVDWEDIEVEPVNRLYLVEENDELLVKLRFGYDEYELAYEKDLPSVSVQRKPEAWTLVRVHRQSEVEEAVYRSISSASHGLKYARVNKHPDNVFLLRARVDLVDFLLNRIPRLIEDGFEIYGEEKLKKAKVNRHKPTLSLNVSSGIDWFDLDAVVKFGEIEASLKEVRKALRKKQHFVKLADGSIGEIPGEWVERYKHLFGLGEQTDDGIRLSNHHLTIIDQLLSDADRARTDDEFARRRERLLNFEGIESKELPASFTGELRPYQKAGYDWLHFLHEYEFGGCLADDMGLGKTIETLALLLSHHENGHAKAANLIVLPRSLLINWERETENFAPKLSTLIHHGPERTEDLSVFDEYDLILTTYGVMRNDIEILREYKFHYAILDESQAIKNPVAKVSKAARLLRSDHRLVLTGTPVENTTFELWSQFAFLNPGLLGNLEYFKREFGNPIEREEDANTAQFLSKMVYPFILRRTKEKVAPDLPPRTERVVYVDMEPAQLKFYNKTRDYYRGMLLGIIEEEGMNNARMKVLEGLLRLRQISNHPKLVKENFRGHSGKLNLLMETLENLRNSGHKALVFSQFVQMLKLVRAEMDAANIPYLYLDGRTRKRQERVDEFQANDDIPFFLISLRAGGVGLNLTAADYVIHIDPWWNPAVEMQATDRTHRIGQDKPVFVYKYITRDTVEEKILKLQEQKKELVEKLITTEKSFFKSLSSDDVDVLFS